MRTTILAILLCGLVACSAEETRLEQDFGFDGSCVNCHAGLSAGHVHPNYKLRCVDCHGGDDQIDVAENASQREELFRDPAVIKRAHVAPKPGLARFFFANGIDDDGDGVVDETIVRDATQVMDFGEVFEPGLHGEGAGEFIDTELQRDLNYTRFLNPGDLRVASISCGSNARAALDGGGGGGCHQQTIDIVRRSVMVNQSAVINGAYYGNESWRESWLAAQGAVAEPRAGAFGYTLDYDGVDRCIDADEARADVPGGRAQARFDSECLEAQATRQDPAVAAGAQGNANLPAFEMAQGTLKPVAGVVAGTTIVHTGAGDQRLPWGGNASTSDALPELQPIPCNGLLGADCLIGGVPDPVDNILRTFRAYYPMNYPGSTNNFNFTFGSSILPDVARFVTANPYGRGHSAGCSGCHASYSYEGSRRATPVRQDDGTIVEVVDPTTKHREFDGRTQDRGVLNGNDTLIGRAVTKQQQDDTGRAQQKTYSESHSLTAKVTTKTCGLCHGFVTRINLAYQGMAEEEQRDQLARRAPIDFFTPSPASTHVVIRDSWVRIDNDQAGAVVEGDCAVRPCGRETAVGVIAAARARDAQLAQLGLIPGGGGCAQETFTEDCNNNGELDRNLVLERRDEGGGVVASTTINEDANGNGILDLIDRLPREESIDGRQMRYVYGGRNGATRQMDVHFERGMHCIDCHFIQDVHGDGHVYSTNWDSIEVECDDCHGARERATLVTSGPNGGNDLRRGKNHDLVPFFDEKGGAIIQRSRVTPGVFWKVPQTADTQNPYAIEAHSASHLAAPGQGSTFSASGALTTAKLECSACHGSWIHNCMGCHVDLNVGDPQRATVDAAGAIVQRAGENEVWLSNFTNPGHINFQLLGLLRSPFILGVSSKTEHGRLGPFRSSMQVHVSITDGAGDTLHDNATFTTFQATDANSGRANVATSAVAMNQTMPHTVRPREARGCESCHPLLDDQDNVRNEHVLAQTYGLGTGAYPYAGDWAIAAGAGGIELFEHKQERELPANIVGRSQRFPGMVVNPATRTAAGVEPTLGGTANDVLLIRNFQPTPVGPMVLPPTLRDLAVIGLDIGQVVIADIAQRGHPTAVRTRTITVGMPAGVRALAHISPDTSDPFVYAAVGASGVSVIEILAPASAGGMPTAALRGTVALPGGRTATDVVLAGDVLYAGTADGTIQVLSISNPRAPTVVGSVTVAPTAVNDMAVAGFVLYAATSSGLATVALDIPQNPVLLARIGGAALGVAIHEGFAYVAAGADGVVQVDARTAAAPIINGSIVPVGEAVNAVDVVLSQLPGQTWVHTLEANGNFVGIKLNTTVSLREACYPDPRSVGCLLDLQFMDPTIMGRDPSFDPITGTFDVADPSSVVFFRQARGLITTGTRLARPAVWETLGTLTGRRMRDSFMPGSGALSLEVMQRMRGVAICETNEPSNHPAGLGALGYAEGGTCQPFGLSALRRAGCRTSSGGGLAVVCSPNFAFGDPVPDFGMPPDDFAAPPDDDGADAAAPAAARAGNSAPPAVRRIEPPWRAPEPAASGNRTTWRTTSAATAAPASSGSRVVVPWRAPTAPAAAAAPAPSGGRVVVPWRAGTGASAARRAPNR